MPDRLLAEYPALTRAAAAQRGSRNALLRIQHARRETVLDPEALGKILPARDIVVAHGAANSATRSELWDVTRRCEDLSDGVREIRNLFRTVDEDVAAAFEALLGCLPEVGR